MSTSSQEEPEQVAPRLGIPLSNVTLSGKQSSQIIKQLKTQIAAIMRTPSKRPYVRLDVLAYSEQKTITFLKER
jgi:hypothetical protein|tara:strand:- start:442 stop:663 length:222 start_codon:yes stop_codon:yes gene_type:complete